MSARLVVTCQSVRRSTLVGPPRPCDEITLFLIKEQTGQRPTPPKYNHHQQMVTVRGEAKVKGCKSEGAHLIEHGFQIKSRRVGNAAQESNQAMIHKHSIACKTCRQGSISSGVCTAWRTIYTQETRQWFYQLVKSTGACWHEQLRSYL